MEYRLIVKPNGKVITEVLDREGQQCSVIRNVTNALGKTLDDETTGPECEPVVEISGER